MKKTHWKKEFNYSYMGSYSLPDGQDVILTIKKTRKELVKGTNGKEENCFVCYFEESEKPMILNKTNCKTIEKLYRTPYIEQWAGIRVQIGIDTVSAFGETVEALRIRMIKPSPEKNDDFTPQIEALKKCKTLAELQKVFTAMTPNQKAATVNTKDELKLKLQ